MLDLRAHFWTSPELVDWTSPELVDTCSRLGEPGGVGWKDVGDGRLRTTTNGRRLTL